MPRTAKDRSLFIVGSVTVESTSDGDVVVRGATIKGEGDHRFFAMDAETYAARAALVHTYLVAHATMMAMSPEERAEKYPTAASIPVPPAFHKEPAQYHASRTLSEAYRDAFPLMPDGKRSLATLNPDGDGIVHRTYRSGALDGWKLATIKFTPVVAPSAETKRTKSIALDALPE